MTTNKSEERLPSRRWRLPRLDAGDLSLILMTLALMLVWTLWGDRLFTAWSGPTEADDAEEIVELADLKDGWTDPDALTFTHDGTVHLPKHGLRVRRKRSGDATMEVVEVANGAHRAVLSEPHQYRTIFPFEFGAQEETPWDPLGRAKDDEPVELALPSCADYRDLNSLIPAEPCPAGIIASAPHIGPTLPRYAMTLQITDMPTGSYGWTSPDAFAIERYGDENEPDGCLVLDLFRPLDKQPTPAATVKITSLGRGRGWLADGPVPAAADLPKPAKGWQHFYYNARATQGSYLRCPPY